VRQLARLDVARAMRDRSTISDDHRIIDSETTSIQSSAIPISICRSAVPDCDHAGLGQYRCRLPCARQIERRPRRFGLAADDQRLFPDRGSPILDPASRSEIGETLTEIGFSSYQGYRYSHEMDDFRSDRAEKEAPQRTHSMGAHHERLPTHSSASRHGSACLPLGPPSGLRPAP